MIFNCEALKKFYRGDYLQYSHILPNALFCVIRITGSNIHQGFLQEKSKYDNGGS